MSAGSSASPLRASVVICTNRPGGLARAVKSVLANETPPFDLLVVAQGTDASWAERELAGLLGDSRLRIVHDPGRGLSHARNVGIDQTVGDVILFTDDDCTVAPDWVAGHVARYAEQPEAMMVFGRVLPPDSYFGPEGTVPVFDPAGAAGTARMRGRIVLGMGANMSLRRDLVRRIGRFDEALGAGASLPSCEDFDLSLRAAGDALSTVADERPVVVHVGGLRPAGRPARKLWLRDGMGLGALLAKSARLRNWEGARALLGMLAAISVSAAAAVVQGRRPSGVMMAACLNLGAVSGFVHGMRQPLLLRDGVFAPPP